MWLVWLPMDEMQGDAGDSGQDSGPGLVGCRGPGILRERGRWSDTHLLMYSPVRMTLQVWHLKQLTCHCLSSARSDWPCLISSLHPAQSAKTKVGHLGSLRLPAIIPCHGNPVPDAILPRPRPPLWCCQYPETLPDKRKGCQSSGPWERTTE